MAKHTETVNGLSVVIGDDDSLHIGGKAIDYTHDAASNTWSSRYLPYTRYDSLIELGRAIARDTVEFIDAPRAPE